MENNAQKDEALDTLFVDKKKSKKNSTVQKLYTIVLFLLVLLIPLSFINNTIKERANFKIAAADDVARSWASAQVVRLPKLVVGKDSLKLGDFNTEATVITENKKKDIFKIPVYTAKIKINGTFLTEGKNLKNGPAKGALSLSVTDPRGYLTKPDIKLDGKVLTNCTNSVCPVDIKDEKKPIPFEIEYTLRGTKQLLFEAGGQTSNLKVVSTWHQPKYIGVFAPTTSSALKNKYQAQWSVPQIALEDPLVYQQLTYGLSFENPVDNYRMTERVTKYGFLFLSLTFLAFFVSEITRKKNFVHPFQYTLIGISMLIFYMLLLSMSEFLPFWLSYLTASVMTIGLISGYAYFVLTKGTDKKFGIFIAGVLTVLYLYLYTAVNIEKYALLFGSFGLFIIMILVMYATRNVQWYKSEETEK